MPEILKEPTKLAVAGDFHGNGNWAQRVIRRAKEEGADALIQVGDFGFWPGSGGGTTYLDMVEEAVKETGLWFAWLPGNHEVWPQLPEVGRGKKPAFVRNTIFLPVGYRWEWWGKQFMAVGGAFSIDRFMRKEGVSYWDEETLTDEDVAWACHQPHGVDVILAHDCPTGVNIPTIGPDSKPRGGAEIWPPDMLAGARAHRLKMREIWEAHQPELWIHGHYHIPHETWLRDTVFRGLDQDGGHWMDSVMFVEPTDLG